MVGKLGRIGLGRKALRTEQHHRVGACAAGVCLLIALLAANSAFADPEVALPRSRPSLQQIEEAREDPELEASEVEPTNPGAAERLPHTELDRAEAINLLSSVFSSELEAAPGVYDDLEVEHFNSNYVAVLGPGDQLEELGDGAPRNQPTLLESTLPLRTENDAGELEAVDLTLQHEDGELQPANPLVEVGVPEELGQGIQLPDTGIKIALDGAPAERAPTEIEDGAAVFPNVSNDTDFTVAPTPTGMETMTQMRSAEAPRSETFHLSLPEGGVLSESSDGGAEARVGERAILRVRPPSALDANGDPVAASLAIEGDSLKITAEPGTDAVYPILVDPIYDVYFLGNLGAWGAPNYAGWTAHVNEPNHFSTPTTEWCSACNDVVYGMYLDASKGEGLPSPPSEADWSYHVPRFGMNVDGEGHSGLNPNVYINNGYFEDLSFTDNYSEAVNSDPFMEIYLWDEYNGFVTIRHHYGTEWNLFEPNVRFELPNELHDTHAQKMTAELVSTSRGTDWRHMYVGDANIELVDTDYPKLSEVYDPSGWVNSTPSLKLPFQASDSGLGVYEIRVAETTSSGGIKVISTRYNECSGGARSVCPQVWSSGTGPAAGYDPSVMPDGEDFVSLAAFDPVGHNSTLSTGAEVPVKTKIKVDHTAPKVAISGPLTEQESLGTSLSSYALNYKATDGTDAPAVAQEPFGSLGSATSPIQFNGPRGVASDQNGHVWVVDRGNNRVLEFSEEGKFLRQIGKAGPGNGEFKEPYGVTVTPEGNIWVTDTGNHRVQEFGPTGTYLQQFGTAATTSSGSGFVEPLGVASTPEGMLWVADGAGHRVAEFSGASGQFLRDVSGSETSFPRGVAVDSKGGLWVVDNGCTCVRSFSSTGTYIGSFGTVGTGEGQFKTPMAIAATPTGNLLVSDGENNRIEQFKPNGEFVRQFGSAGTGSANFNGPHGLAVLKNNSIFVADMKNNRIARWANAEYDPQSGAAKVEIKVDGVPQTPIDAPGCATRDCKIEHSWTLEASKFSDGPHTVEVIATDGVGLTSTPVKIPIVLRPDRTAPTVSLSGSMTEQATLGNQRPRYILKMAASDPGSYSSSFGTPGTGNGQFAHPADVAVDSKGNIWVADRGNNRIEKFKENWEFIGAYGGSGTAGGKLSSPSAISVDPSNNVWVADTANNRIEEFSESGAFVAAIGKDVNKTKVGSGGTEAERNYCSAASGNVCQAGPEGTAAGQLKAPQGIAVTSSGNIWVADTGHSRMEKYTPTGALLNSAFQEGSEPGRLKSPTAVAIAPDNSIWVADTGNNRIERWLATDLGSPAGVYGSEGTGNGQFKHPAALEVDSAGNVWVGDEGNDRIEELSGTGTYLGQFGSKGFGPGVFNFSAPMGLTIDTKGNLLITDPENNRVVKWSYASGTSSGVATVAIRIDGKVVDSSSPGCVVGGCSVSREWTLNSGSYAAGSHTVEASAADALGHGTTKSMTINIARDTTPPQVTANASLYTAPEGWVEQQSYPVTAFATDPNGYGVTALTLKVDSEVVKSETQSCPDGGCGETLTGLLNLANYSGGAHPAELIVADGAGNKYVKHWTINVDPEGHVSAEEAADTLEAVDSTANSLVVAPSWEVVSPEERADGNNPGLKATGTVLESTGVPDKSTLGFASNGGFEVESPEGSIKAVMTGAGSPTPTEIANGSVAITGNTVSSTDTVIRPIYDGVMTFQSIRDVSAPETYSWEVTLHEGQSLRLVNSTTAQVEYAEEKRLSFLITAEQAHDAVGTAVPTSLSVAGNILTLTVSHRSSSFVYPVIAGAGWEGGFRTVDIPIPPQEEHQSESEEEEAIEAELEVFPPEPGTPDEAGVSSEEAKGFDADASKAPAFKLWRQKVQHRKFRWIQCNKLPEWPSIGDLPIAPRPGGDCGNPFSDTEGGGDVAFSYGIRGDYWEVSGFWVKQRGTPTDHIECDKMYNPGNVEADGHPPESYFISPAQQCKWYGNTKYSRDPTAKNVNGESHHLTPYGEWNWGHSGQPGEGGYKTHQAGLALYIWASPDDHVGHHKTTCIDC